MRQLPSEEEFQNWLLQPETRVFWDLLRRWKENLQDQWARGVFQEDSVEETAMANANALGELNLLNQLLELSYENLKDSFDDE